MQLQLRRRGVRSSRDRVYIVSFRMGEEVGERVEGSSALVAALRAVK